MALLSCAAAAGQHGAAARLRLLRPPTNEIIVCGTAIKLSLSFEDGARTITQFVAGDSKGRSIA